MAAWALDKLEKDKYYPDVFTQGTAQAKIWQQSLALAGVQPDETILK